jgi:hypothetical protein
VARNMLDRSTSVVHAWAEQGGLKGSREDLTRPQATQMTNEVMLCLVRKLARVGKVAVLLHSQRFNRNGTRRVAVHVQCRVYTSSPLPVKVVETVGG